MSNPQQPEEQQPQPPPPSQQQQPPQQQASGTIVNDETDTAEEPKIPFCMGLLIIYFVHFAQLIFLITGLGRLFAGSAFGLVQFCFSPLFQVILAATVYLGLVTVTAGIASVLYVAQVILVAVNMVTWVADLFLLPCVLQTYRSEKKTMLHKAITFCDALVCVAICCGLESAGRAAYAV